MPEQKIIKKNSIKTGIVLTYVRLAVYLVIALVYPPYLLQKVGEADNGLYTFAVSVSALILLISFGIENSYVRFATVSEEKNGEEGLKKTNGFYLVLFGIIALAELIVGVVIAFLYRNGALYLKDATPEIRSKLCQLVLITSLAASSDFFLSIFSWFAYYRSRFAWEQGIILFSHLLTTGFTVLALYFGLDIIWVAWIGLLAQFVMDVANVVYSLVFLKMKFAWMKRAEWKPYLKEVYLFSIWIFFVVAFSQINAYLGKTVLGVMVDSGKTVTVFTYGFQFFAYESLMSQGISNNFSPKINALAVQHKDQEVASLWLRASKLQLVVLFLVVGGFITCGLDFVSYWLRKSHLSATDFRDIYILGAGFLLLWLIPLSETVGIEAQRAYNKHRFLAIFNLSCAIASIGIAILCVAYLPTEYKIYGPLIGMAFSVISGMIVASNIYYKKAMDFPVGRYFATFGIMLGITLAAWAVPFAVFTYGVRLPDDLSGYVVALIKAAVFVLIYLPATALVFRKEIRQELLRLKSKRGAKKNEANS